MVKEHLYNTMFFVFYTVVMIVLNSSYLIWMIANPFIVFYLIKMMTSFEERRHYFFLLIGYLFYSIVVLLFIYQAGDLLSADNIEYAYNFSLFTIPVLLIVNGLSMLIMKLLKKEQESFIYIYYAMVVITTGLLILNIFLINMIGYTP